MKFSKLITCSALLVVSACGDPESNPKPIASQQFGESCDAEHECVAGLYCENGTCRTLCTSDNDCNHMQTCKESRCVNNPNDVCNVGWDGDRCTQCAPGFYGQDCIACPKCGAHGTCKDSLNGDGSCSCELGWEGKLCDTKSPCKEGFTGENCDQCVEGRYGSDCHPGTCEHGQVGSDGHCQEFSCENGWEGSDCNHCPSNWSGENCDACADNYFGKDCEKCLDCGDKGTCDAGIGGTGKCICEAGFGGTACDACKAGYFGLECEKCPECVHGKCEEGLTGQGQCKCDNGWKGDLCEEENKCPPGFTGQNCDQCLDGFYGPKCEPCTCVHGKCNDTLTGDGFCREESCDVGYDGKNCNKCASGYYGENCQLPTCVNGTIDPSNGKCVSGSCDNNYTGDNCDQCAEGFFGPICTKCECNDHGQCDSGLTGTGCICDQIRVGEHCDICIDHTNGCTGYGSVTDKDGNTYKTVQIGNLLWMAEDARGGGSEKCIKPEAYSQDELIHGCLYLGTNATAVCPEGWRLPTVAEYESIKQDGKNVKASSWDKGEDYYGLAFIPTGFIYLNGTFSGYDNQTGDLRGGFFWATNYVAVGDGNTDLANTPNLSLFDFAISVFPRVMVRENNTGLPVRCVQDIK